MYLIIIFLFFIIISQSFLMYYMYRKNRKEKREFLMSLGDLYKKGYHEISLNNALESKKDKIKENEIFNDPAILKNYQTINELFKYLLKEHKANIYDILELSEMKTEDHISYFTTEMNTLMRTPCSNDVEYISVLNKYYLIFFERTIKDHIIPILAIVKKNKINNANNTINAFKVINNGKYSSLVEPFNTTIRNAIAHNSVEYNKKEKIITYNDRKGSLSLSKDDLDKELYKIQSIALTFDLHRDHLLRALIMESKRKQES